MKQKYFQTRSLTNISKNDITPVLFYLLKYNCMKSCLIRSHSRPSSTLLWLQVGLKTGKARFLVKANGLQKIPLSVVALPEVLEEISSKSVLAGKFYELRNPKLSKDTTEFIEACWSELKKLRPELCIK